MNPTEILGLSFLCPFLAVMGAWGGIKAASALFGPLIINNTINLTKTEIK